MIIVRIVRIAFIVPTDIVSVAVCMNSSGVNCVWCMMTSFNVVGTNERTVPRIMCLRIRVDDLIDLWTTGCLLARRTVMQVRLSVRSIPLTL